MTKISLLPAIALCMACASAFAQLAPYSALADTPAQDEEEYLYLDKLADPEKWIPTEAEARRGEELNGHPTLTFHIDVDHHAGEPKYPIGWPRMYLRTPAEIPWKEYDRLEFKVRATTSNPPLPNIAFNLKFTGKPKINFEERFTQKLLKLGEWIPYSLPLNKIAELESFSNCGFYISEANYADKTVLDFSFAEMRLVRSSSCKVVEMEVQGICYTTSTTLPVKLTVYGPASDAARGVPFQIAQCDKVLRKETLPVTRGVQMLKMDISELRLAQGDYTLTAFPDHPERRIAVAFKLIPSPF